MDSKNKRPNEKRGWGMGCLPGINPNYKTPDDFDSYEAYMQDRKKSIDEACERMRTRDMARKNNEMEKPLL